MVHSFPTRRSSDLTLTSLKDGTPDGFVPRPPTFLGGEEFKAGKVTPGLMPWITAPQDRALLRGGYDAYV